MFNYFSNDRSLNNLIWVLCHSDFPNPTFDPGKEYYDIAGADTYQKDRVLKDMFNDMVALHGKDLPIAFHECGTVPDPDKCFEEGATWSWWMVWHTKWLSDQNPEDMKRIYNHELVITLDEVPDIMSYHK